MSSIDRKTLVRGLAGALCFSALGATLAACGAPEAGGDRGGPHSLTGYRWTGPSQTVAGIELQPEFSFDAASVTATNTCNRTVSVSTTAPVRYRYRANIPSSARREEGNGAASCFVEILAGDVEFEIVNNVLRVTRNGTTVDFQPSGSVAGLYGTWVVDAPEVGRLSWSMSGGRIRATVACTNGVSASTDASASFTNMLEITEDSSNQVEEAGLTCSVGIARGMYTYTFEGPELVLSGSGGAIRFIPNPR